MSEQEKGPAILKISPDGEKGRISNRNIAGKVESRGSTSNSYTGNIEDDQPHPDD